jgi:hypothetical protein
VTRLSELSPIGLDTCAAVFCVKDKKWVRATYWAFFPNASGHHDQGT